MDVAKALIPKLAPVRRTLARQGISLARLMSVVMVVTVLVVILGAARPDRVLSRRKAVAAVQNSQLTLLPCPCEQSGD